MKSAFATVRFIPILAAWATLPFAAPLHGAEFSLPFTEDFQSSSFLDSAQTTARWTSSSVTLGHARGQHRAEFTSAPEDVFRIGNSSDNTNIDDIALRDMNGDGRLDIITAGDDGIFVFLVGEMNDLGAVQPVPVTATPSHGLAFGDFEQDGDLDIVAAGRRISLYKNSGQGSFDAGGDVVSLVAAGLAAADVDGDGNLDLVFARQGRSGAVEIYLNDGRGTFTEKTGAARQTDTLSRGLAVGDLDGDGDVDIAIGKFRRNNVYYLNNGDGGFGSARMLRQTQGNHPNNGVALGDVNNDGLLDIVVGGRRANNLLYLNEGGGVFSTGTAVGHGAAVTLEVGLADLDGDGDLDLYEASLSGRGSFAYTNPGNGGYGMTGSRIGPKTNAVAVGDLNGDGNQDVVIGRNLASLDVGLGRNPDSPADAASVARFDSARGRVVSRRIDIDGLALLHVVYFTATAAPSTNTGIDYYLSNDDGNHWRRAYPGRIVRFLSPGNLLRWRAELRSRSPALSTTLTQIGVEGVLQVSIDGLVQRSGNEDPYRVASQTVGETIEAVLKLENRSDRPLEITDIDFTGEGFKVKNKPDSAIPPGRFHNANLVFEPTISGNHPSKLMISSSESGSVLSRFELLLHGEGFAPVMQLSSFPTSARVRSSTNQIVEVENRGNLALEIEHPPTVSTSRFVLIDPDPSGGFPLIVTSDKSVNLEFRFKPVARGTVTASVTFVSNAIGTTETITLEGKGVASEIDVVINNTTMSQAGFLYHFNDWPVNEVTSARVDITNADGDASLRIDSAAIDDEEHFGGIEDELFPIPVIPAGSSMPDLFKLSFAPKRRGVQSTTLTVTSNAINGTQTITLRGHGTGAEIGVEVDGESLASGTTRHLNRIIKVGVATAVEVVLHNRGELPLGIIKLGLSNGNKINDLGFRGTIPPHSSTQTEIDFVLDATGTVVKTLEITSDDPVTPTYQVMLTSTGIAPVMVVTIDEERREPAGAPYDFGKVKFGETTSREMVIHNNGDADLVVDSVGSDGVHLTVSSDHRTASVVIAPDSSKSWTLTFEPGNGGAKTLTGTLVIENDDPNAQPWELGWKGQRAGPKIEVVVGNRRFTSSGTINLSTSYWLTTDVVIWNRGDTELEVTASLESGGRNRYYSLRWSENTHYYSRYRAYPTVTIEPNSSRRWILRLYTNRIGIPYVYEGKITIVSNDSDKSPLELDLRGINPETGMEISFVGDACAGQEPRYIKVDMRMGCLFGNLSSEETKTVTVVITNRGNRPLDNISIALKEDSSPLFNLEGPVSPIIPVGSSHSWALNFTSVNRRERGGEQRGQLNIANHKLLRVLLIGHFTGPKFYLTIGRRGWYGESGGDYDFGDVPAGTTETVRVTVVNRDHKEAFTIRSIAVSGDAYSLVSSESRTVGAGGSETWHLRFAPSDAAIAHEGLLTIASNVYNGSTWTVRLKGRGVYHGIHAFLLNNANRTGYTQIYNGEKYSLGNVIVGQSAYRSIYLGNSVNSSLTVSSLHVNGTDFSVESELTSLPSPGIIEPGVPDTRTGPPRTYYPSYSCPQHRSQRCASAAYAGVVRVSPSHKGVHTGTLIIRNNGVHHSEFMIPLQANAVLPDIRVDGVSANSDGADFRGAYNFGEVSVGDSQSREVTVRNNSESSLVIRLIYFLENVGQQFDVVPPVNRARLSANSSATFSLSFTPAEIGSASAVLVVRESEENHNILSMLALQGSGVRPQMNVGIAEQGSGSGAGNYDFGRVPTDIVRATTVTVSNGGSGNLDIKSIRVIGTGYSLVGDESRLIQAGSSATWSLRFAPPGSAPSYQGALTIISNDKTTTPHGIRTLALNGAGADPDIMVHGNVFSSGNSYQFGHVRVGETKTVTLMTTDNRLPRVSGDAYSHVAGHSPGTWELRFAPTSAIPYSGELKVGEGALSLEGVGANPRMAVEIDGVPCSEGCQHDFGRVDLGSTTDMVQVTVSNTGTVELDVTSIKVTSGHYSLVNNGAPQTIVTGGSITFMLRFMPTLPNTHSSILSIVSNDSRHSTWTASVAGYGVGPQLAMRFVPHRFMRYNLINYDGGRVTNYNRYTSNNELHRVFDVQRAFIGLGPANRPPGDLIYIENIGNEDLTVTDFNIGGVDSSVGWDNGTRFPTWSPFPGDISIASNDKVKVWLKLPKSLYWAKHQLGVLSIASNDPIHPVFKLRLERTEGFGYAEARIANRLIEPGLGYNFGDVPVGSSSSEQITLFSLYRYWFNFWDSDNITVSGNNQFSVVPLLERYDDFWPLRISFTPTVTGTATAKLTLPFIDFRAFSGYGFYSIILRGNGVPATATAPMSSAWADDGQKAAIPAFQVATAPMAPQIQVEIADATQAFGDPDSTSDFPLEPNGGTTQRTVTIRNLGLSTLQISGTTADAEVAPGGATDMDIAFAPTTADGVFAETLTLISSDIRGSSWTMTLAVGADVRHRVLLGGPYPFAADATAPDTADAPADIRFRDVGGGYIGNASPAATVCTYAECDDRRVTYRLANPQVTTDGESRRFRFDVEVRLSSSESSPVFFGAAGIGIRYNTAAFGNGAFAGCKATNLSLTPQPRYSRVVSNPAENVTTWGWGNRTGDGGAKVAYGEVGPDYRGLVRLDCEIADATQRAGVGLDPFGWNQFQAHTTDNRYLRYAAHVENNLLNVPLDGSPYNESAGEIVAAASGAADTSAPRFVGLGYANGQSRLWLGFNEPVQIRTSTGGRALPDGAVLPGFEVLPNFGGHGGDSSIGVLRARYRGGGVAIDLARAIVSSDVSVWVRYTPPPVGRTGIYDTAATPNRISTVRTLSLQRSVTADADNDGIPDATEARLGSNPLLANDVHDAPQVVLSRTGIAGSPAAIAYSGIRADGVVAHLGVVTTSASSLAAYYLSDTFGYSSGYAPGVEGYGCTGQFPADYASPVRGGGCAMVDFNNIRTGVEHRIGWLAMNDAGYWAVAEGTASRLPEQVILRVPEFNMKRRNVFVANSAAADAAVRVSAFHDGLASLSPLTVSLSNVAAADSPSSKEPDGFSVSVADVTTDTTSYAITGVHSGEDSKLWLAGDPLSSLTPDKYSLGKVTQTSVVRLADDNLPPLFGRASLYEGSTADENERHAVVVRGTENYIALLPVVHGSAQTASAFEVSPWDGERGGPVAADDRILAVNAASPVADGALVRIAFTASSPPATVRNTVSLEVAAASAGASTATTVLTWPVIDSADALASIAGDGDNDGIPDVRDSYRLLNRLPISVAGGVSGYPDRSSAGADGWHHIRPLLPLHNQFVGSYATRAGLQFHTGFEGDARILARLPVATSGGQAIAASGEQTIVAPEGQSVLAASYQPGIPIQMNYADFAASLSRDEFAAMARQSRQDIAVVYNFRLHGVEPSVEQGASLAGGRAGVVIPLPESLHEHASILPLHYTNGAWSGFSTEPDTPGTAGFAPLQAGVCPDDSGVAGSAYRTTGGALNTRKRTGDACMVLYLTDGAAADRDGNINGVVDALIGLAVITLPR